MNQSPKSATTAGLLGIFLGSVGAHSWYLGDKKNGIIHVCLFGGGILLEVIGSVILPAVFLNSFSLGALSFIPVISGLGAAVISANGIWGLVEGIIILSKGDAGLAAKGIPVATAVQQPYAGQPMPQQGYAQGYNQGYAQPMQQPMQQPMGQPMPNQPMGQQPMNQPAQPSDPSQPASDGSMNNAA